MILECWKLAKADHAKECDTRGQPGWRHFKKVWGGWWRLDLWEPTRSQKARVFVHLCCGWNPKAQHTPDLGSKRKLYCSPMAGPHYFYWPAYSDTKTLLISVLKNYLSNNTYQVTGNCPREYSKRRYIYIRKSKFQQKQWEFVVCEPWSTNSSGWWRHCLDMCKDVELFLPLIPSRGTWLPLVEAGHC